MCEHARQLSLPKEGCHVCVTYVSDMARSNCDYVYAFMSLSAITDRSIMLPNNIWLKKAPRIRYIFV